jgi:pimeloyl-ACP methyl ester carboxylesterase
MGNEPLVRDETITLDGLRLHYRDWGDPDAPPVVLLHAYLQYARTWDTVACGLANGFRVLALDHRGFGESARLRTTTNCVSSPTWAASSSPSELGPFLPSASR